jgi:hypothetical protein
MDKMYFAHRPPTVGVHLLNDPFPPQMGQTISTSRVKSVTVRGTTGKGKARPKKKPHKS